MARSAHESDIAAWSTVDAAPVAYQDRHNNTLSIIDCVDNSVIPHTHPVSFSARQFAGGGRARFGGKERNCASNPVDGSGVKLS